MEYANLNKGRQSQGVQKRKERAPTHLNAKESGVDFLKQDIPGELLKTPGKDEVIFTHLHL